jgi:hypothetical protein
MVTLVNMRDFEPTGIQTRFCGKPYYCMVPTQWYVVGHARIYMQVEIWIRV